MLQTGHRQRGTGIDTRRSNMRSMGTGRRTFVFVGGRVDRLCGHADVCAVVADQRRMWIPTLRLRDISSEVD